MGPGQKTNAIVSDDACFYYIIKEQKNQVLAYDLCCTIYQRLPNILFLSPKHWQGCTRHITYRAIYGNCQIPDKYAV